MAEITALIVAAGRGVRMGERGRMMPKGMIALDGLPLVRASVLHLRSRDIAQVRIVTGHLSEAYEAEFGGEDGIELIHNPAYADTGSLNSLLTGLQGLDGPVMILESDIMYEPRALDPLLGNAGSGLVLSGPTGAGDEVYVWTETGGQLVDMSKVRVHREADPAGELVGISALSAGDLAPYQATARALIERDPKADYETGVVAHAAAHPYLCHLIPDLAWAEVDDETMLAHARTHVWPRASAGLPRDGDARAV